MLVDSQHDRRQLMGYVVALAAGVTVVGHADTVAGALRAVEASSPTAVVVEIQMPVAEGLDAVGALRAAHPDLRIVVCSFHATAATRQGALDRGADCYLVKPLSPSEVGAALRG